MGSVSQILKITFTLVLVYLLVTYWRGSTALVRTVGNTYAGGVKALQGR